MRGNPECDNCHGVGVYSDTLQDVEVVCPCVTGSRSIEPHSKEEKVIHFHTYDTCGKCARERDEKAEAELVALRTACEVYNTAHTTAVVARDNMKRERDLAVARVAELEAELRRIANLENDYDNPHDAALVARGIAEKSLQFRPPCAYCGGESAGDADGVVLCNRAECCRAHEKRTNETLPALRIGSAVSIGSEALVEYRHRVGLVCAARSGEIFVKINGENKARWFLRKDVYPLPENRSNEASLEVTDIQQDVARAAEVANYVQMGPGWNDVKTRVYRLLREARKEERALCSDKDNG